MTPRAPAEVEVTTPTAVRLRARPGVRVLRRDLDEVDRTRRHRLWVTAAPLTVLQTAITRDDGSTFLDRALQRHVRLDDLRVTHSRHLGTRGSARAGQLLAAAADGAESAAERLLVRHLRRARITGWVLGLPFGSYLVDLAFPDARLAVEVDGWAFHSDARRFAADRRKGNAITRSGWNLLRFTWHDLDGCPTACLQEIRSMLAAAA